MSLNLVYLKINKIKLTSKIYKNEMFSKDLQFSTKTTNVMNRNIAHWFNINAMRTKINKHFNGTCSEEALEIGFHQKVISFSLYGENRNYWKGLDEIFDSIQKLYQGWFIRLYTDASKSTVFVKLKSKFNNLHVCDVNHLPPPLKNVKKIPSMLWRLLPILDPQVDYVLIRDTDSQVRGIQGYVYTAVLTVS